WIHSRGRFDSLECGFFTHQGSDVIHLPFYRLRANISGITLVSYADLIRVANLPRVARDNCQDLPFYFWSPAFKIRPQNLLNFSARLTISQPEESPDSGIPPERLHPVTLPIPEGPELMRMTLACFLKPPFRMEKLDEITISPRNARLVYIPFQVRGRELHQPRFNLRTNINILNYSMRL
ncbi:MAG: hypothetical protein PHU03_07425, partial [Syntrophales bacterium]|nr:hypothetical protein [Syntrophales bacterium]